MDVLGLVQKYLFGGGGGSKPAPAKKTVNKPAVVAKPQVQAPSPSSGGYSSSAVSQAAAPSGPFASPTQLTSAPAGGGGTDFGSILGAAKDFVTQQYGDYFKSQQDVLKQQQDLVNARRQAALDILNTQETQGKADIQRAGTAASSQASAEYAALGGKPDAMLTNTQANIAIDTQNSLNKLATTISDARVKEELGASADALQILSDQNALTKNEADTITNMAEKMLTAQNNQEKFQWKQMIDMATLEIRQRHENVYESKGSGGGNKVAYTDPSTGQTLYLTANEYLSQQKNDPTKQALTNLVGFASDPSKGAPAAWNYIHSIEPIAGEQGIDTSRLWNYYNKAFPGGGGSNSGRGFGSVFDYAKNFISGFKGQQ